ncbi:hypothetical protein SAMN05216249_10584 [Acetitomaculum ruminis DSM 5522]|uniref:Uncharacterized protein n=1 Tax=Acetitomaculum ruminis DSM 5522 TaxID=1120918 RepID=A0A1I0X0B0_9FIRM|nr:hypothetical protein [Acetitomaculum ruminis]SFA93818.1 hypothetical protein SAMN05216249_10584 [Acetitomaculum ruminis DSM 5522]
MNINNVCLAFFMLSLLGMVVFTILCLVSLFRKDFIKSIMKFFSLLFCSLVFVASIYVLNNGLPDLSYISNKITAFATKEKISSSDVLIKDSDFSLILKDNHPKFYGSTKKAHEIWNEIITNKIIFSDSSFDYSDYTVLNMKGDTNDDTIRRIEIYFQNFANNEKVDINEAETVRDAYLPKDILDKWYKKEDDYLLIPKDNNLSKDEDDENEKNTCHVLSYALTKKGLKAWNNNKHTYASHIYSIIYYYSDKNADYLTISQSLPKWMKSPGQNGYVKEKIEDE